MSTAYIVSAARTPIGAFGGAFQDIPAWHLGGIVIREVLERAGVKPEQVDEAIMGCVLQAGQGQGPGRQAALKAGLPVTTPAWAVNQLCGSGLKAVCLAASLIGNGDAECIVAGGMENMTMAPFLAPIKRVGTGRPIFGALEVRDSMMVDGLTCVFSNQAMGMTAEAIAEKYGITRDEQDAFAAESQRRAGEAMREGRFKDEIVPVPVPQKKGEPVLVTTDEHPRPETTVESLAKLRPAFKKDGSVTAGNSSGINDGAAAVVVVSEAFLKKHGLKPLARIAGTGITALDPLYMGMGPVESTRRALGKAGWNIDDLGRAELNEAFAVQSVAVVRELGLDKAKVNVNGGAVALGHPIGASGARILVTLLYEMERAKVERGLASLCVGGGMGTALVVEKL